MAPKTVLDKVLAAIDSLAEPGGASRPAIAKYVKATFGEVSPALLKKALAAGVKSGKLLQTGQRFALEGVVIAPREGESVEKSIIKTGDGAVATIGDEVDMKYVGTLEIDGSTFDRAAHFKFVLGAGDVIKGWDQGIVGMRVGERAKLIVPPKLGYGKKGAGPEIPPDSTLVVRLRPALSGLLPACLPPARASPRTQCRLSLLGAIAWTLHERAVRTRAVRRYPEQDLLRRTAAVN